MKKLLKIMTSVLPYALVLPNGLLQTVSSSSKKILRSVEKIWRVNKSDPDPFPSNPHAHCIGGSGRFVGCKLHLGTGELYDSSNKPLGRYLYKKQFERLLELIQPKFPEVVFPLPIA
jgi:hypothetical protein